MMVVTSNPGWRFLDTESASGPVNMAIDEALMESVRRGAAPTLRVYRWSRPCVSLGRNQPARDWYDHRRLEASGVDVVRRPTGGRAVLHDEELTYSVVCPDRELGPPRTAYRRINQVLIAGLTALGAEVGIVGATAAASPRPSTVPCFVEPTEGEILARGKKLVGSAQVRIDGVLLQQGSLPLRPGRVTGMAAVFGIAASATPAYLESILAGPIPWERLTAVLQAAWATSIGALIPSRLTADERDRSAAMTRRYEHPEWTWRR